MGAEPQTPAALGPFRHLNLHGHGLPGPCLHPRLSRAAGEALVAQPHSPQTEQMEGTGWLPEPRCAVQGLPVPPDAVADGGGCELPVPPAGTTQGLGHSLPSLLGKGLGAGWGHGGWLEGLSCQQRHRSGNSPMGMCL